MLIAVKNVRKFAVQNVACAKLHILSNISLVNGYFMHLHNLHTTPKRHLIEIRTFLEKNNSYLEKYKFAWRFERLRGNTDCFPLHFVFCSLAMVTWFNVTILINNTTVLLSLTGGGGGGGGGEGVNLRFLELMIITGNEKIVQKNSRSVLTLFGREIMEAQYISLYSVSQVFWLLYSLLTDEQYLNKTYHFISKTFL